MWYYAQSGKTFGPVSLEQLKELARTGTLRPIDHILAVGTQEWRPAATLEGLFTPARPAGPPAGPPPIKAAPPPMPEFASGGPETWSIESPPMIPGGPPPMDRRPMDYGPPSP